MCALYALYGTEEGRGHVRCRGEGVRMARVMMRCPLLLEAHRTHAHARTHAHTHPPLFCTDKMNCETLPNNPPATPQVCR